MCSLLNTVVVLSMCMVLGVRGERIVTRLGAVVGVDTMVNLENGNSKQISSFWGIPYAAPPVGNLRFAPTQDHAGWTGDLDATELPDMCMQSPIGLMFMTHPFWTRYDEDCLTLNIFKPTELTGGPLAVFVWFHGGGYTGGGSIQYPGHFLAAKDTVVVVVNYRLGVFGFAATPDNTIGGNMGMLDQIKALEFVRDNIAAFGGNPNFVTIFGQSAGASSAALHMVSPKSKGLFYQAIMESGAENNIWTINTPAQNPRHYIYQVAERLNCMRPTDPEMVDCLRAVHPTRLRMEDHLECTVGTFCQGFAPIMDGPGGFLPDMPLTLREQLGEDSVPVIGGHCKDDGSLYTLYFIPEADAGGFTRDEFQYLLRTRLVDIFGPSADTEEHYENAYQAFDWFYSPWPYLDDEEANRQAFNKMLTDGAFGYAWDRNARINSKYRDTYTYIQSFRSLNATSFIPEWMGVPHNGELAYVWAYSYLLINPLVRDDSGIHFDILGWTPEDITYSNYVLTLWSNFGKYGNPTPQPVMAPFNNTLTTWPKYDESTNFRTLNLDGEISILDKYRKKDYAFYEEYLSYVAKKPVLKTTEKSSVPRRKYQMKTSHIQEVITKKAIEIVKNLFPDTYEEKMKEFMQKIETY